MAIKFENLKHISRKFLYTLKHSDISQSYMFKTKAHMIGLLFCLLKLIFHVDFLALIALLPGGQQRPYQ
jgi:hypothetical protein